MTDDLTAAIRHGRRWIARGGSLNDAARQIADRFDVSIEQATDELLGVAPECRLPSCERPAPDPRSLCDVHRCGSDCCPKPAYSSGFCYFHYQTAVSEAGGFDAFHGTKPR